MLTFQRKVMKHLVEHGLDTITYLPDPADKYEMISVVSDHARFNHKTDGAMANKRMESKFDKYDIQNDKDAKDFLLSSVDEDLEKEL